MPASRRRASGRRAGPAESWRAAQVDLGARAMARDAHLLAAIESHPHRRAAARASSIAATVSGVRFCFAPNPPPTCSAIRCTLLVGEPEALCDAAPRHTQPPGLRRAPRAHRHPSARRRRGVPGCMDLAISTPSALDEQRSPVSRACATRRRAVRQRWERTETGPRTFPARTPAPAVPPRHSAAGATGIGLDRRARPLARAPFHANHRGQWLIVHGNQCQRLPRGFPIGRRHGRDFLADIAHNPSPVEQFDAGAYARQARAPPIDQSRERSRARAESAGSFPRAGPEA